MAENVQDMFVTVTDSLLTMISEKNDLEGQRGKVGEQGAISGVVAAHAYTKGADLCWEFLEYDQFGWDTNATKDDFSDGEYCFVFKYIPVAALCERFQPSAEKIKQIGNAVSVAKMKACVSAIMADAAPRERAPAFREAAE